MGSFDQPGRHRTGVVDLCSVATSLVATDDLEVHDEGQRERAIFGFVDRRGDDGMVPSFHAPDLGGPGSRDEGCGFRCGLKHRIFGEVDRAMQ